MSRKQSVLTYHGNPTRWADRDGYTELNSVARGQEFVMDTQTVPDALEWVEEIMSART